MSRYPKSRLPKHVREWLKDGESYVYSVQYPEAALTEMTSLMVYFMEKYEDTSRELANRNKELKSIREKINRGDLVNRPMY